MLLVRKNMRIRLRQRWGMVLEIVLPALLSLALLGIHSAVNIEEYVGNLNAHSSFTELGCGGPFQSSLVIVPESSETLEFASFLGNNSCFPNIQFYDTEEAMENELKSSDYNDTIAYAVVFTSTSPSWDYTIRMQNELTPHVPPPADIVSTRERNLLLNPSNSSYYSYAGNGFLSIQQFTDEWIIAKESGVQFSITPNSLYRVLPGQFAMPSFKYDEFWDIASDLDLFIYLTFMLLFNHTLKSIVEEKEREIKEGMKMMGLSDTALWLSWFITYGISAFLASLLSAFVLSVGVFEASSYFYIFIWLLLFQLSLISLAFMLSTLFSTSKSATRWGTLFFFAGYILSGFFPIEDSSHGQLLGTCVLSTACFSVSFQTITGLESSALGVTPATVDVSLYTITWSEIMLFLCMDIILYLFIAWYLGEVIPSEYGSSRPFYFIFTKKFWMNEEVLKNDECVQLIQSSDAIESVSPELASLDGIKIRNLRKEYDSDKGTFVAVDDLSLDIYQGEVFALLGHNGAGKTTTISMVTGLINATSGDATVFGHSIRTDMDNVHKLIGVCPQRNILFDDLTVQEHLQLFARLQGTPESEVKSMVEDMVNEVGLIDKKDALSKTLSGGMKRKLSCAIAFIGNPKVVFLDEPTSGMDVHSRRSTWEIIKKYKQDKVIILTTHFMDEADMLGDRVGIMSHGKLICCGTSLFLKSKYGVGYTLVVTRTDDGAGNRGPDSPLMKALHSFVSSFEVLNDVGHELFVQIPFTESAKFPHMFREFDQNGSYYGVQNYAISVTTLEEVFLKVGENQQLKEPDSDVPNPEKLTKIHEIMKRSGEQAEMSDLQVYFRHTYALLMKRFNHYKRDRMSLLFQVFLPCLFVMFGLIIQKTVFKTTFHEMIFSLDNLGATGQPVPEWKLSPALQSNLDLNFVEINPDPSNIQNVLNDTSPEYLSWFVAKSDFHDQVSSSIEDVASSSNGVLYGAYADFEGLLFGGNAEHQVSVLTNYSSDHAYPTFVNAYSNSLLQTLVGSTAVSITTRIHPFPLTAEEEETTEMIRGFILLTYLLMAAAMIPGSFVTYIVSERQNKSKHQQIISGVSIPAYWISNMLWDGITYLLPFSIIICMLAIADLENFTGSHVVGATFTVFFLYGLSVIPLTYLISSGFKSPGSARGVVIMVFFVTGLMLSIASNIMNEIESTKDINDSLINIYRLFPVFCLGDTLYKLALNVDRRSGWSSDIAGTNILFMVVEMFVYLAIAIVVEYMISIPKFAKILRKAFRMDKDVPLDETVVEDEDVAKERENIATGKENGTQVVVKGLRKIYGDFVAVKNLYFSIPQGQCFGFLGVNGAGKTTTLSILAGDIPMTEGSAKLAGMDVLQDQLDMRRLIGYCPQFDALFELLTAREHLEFYARVKGVPEDLIPDIVSGMIHYLSLDEYADRPAGKYSGGNKRKLSVAIALIGDPPIVFLDEPSTGVDPVARRFMWRFISETMAGRVVVLTTHSMEECEALCNRLGIMVDGRLACLGTPQHLKTRFGQGYQLDISTNPENADRLKHTIVELLGGTGQLLEQHEGVMKFKIPKLVDQSLADLFELIEKSKADLGISEYSVGQTTLEQIFIYFAQQQQARETQQAITVPE